MPVPNIEDDFVEKPFHPGLLAFPAAGQADLAFAGEGDEARGVAVGALQMPEPAARIGTAQEVPDRLLGPLPVVAVGLPKLLVPDLTEPVEISQEDPAELRAQVVGRCILFRDCLFHGSHRQKQMVYQIWQN